MADEELEYGRAGIDTQAERDIINYRPNIKYEKQLIYSNGSILDAESEEKLEELGEASIVQVIQDAIQAVELIDELETTLSEKLKDTYVPIHAAYLEQVQQAAQKLGYSLTTNNIPFELYKKTFEVEKSPASEFIQDIYEDYISDVNGSLNAELYADLKEMQIDWKNMTDFIKRGLIAQILPVADIPTDLKTEDAQETIAAKEAEMAEQYALLLRLRAVSKQVFYELTDLDYGSERYFKAQEDYDSVHREVVNLEKRLFTKAEVVDLIGRKASDTTDNLELIQNTVDYDPYKDDRYSLLYGVLSQFPSKSNMQSGLKRVQAMLKLSIDGKKVDLSSVTSTLRNLAGNENKQRINNTLVNGVHLRNEVSNEVTDFMEYMEGVPNNQNFEVMLDHIATGVEQAEKAYQSQTSDFYKAHVMDAGLREERLKKIIDKDAARSAYQLMGSVVNYSAVNDVTWPGDGENLSSWLDSFMESNKIT